MDRLCPSAPNTPAALPIPRASPAPALRCTRIFRIRRCTPSIPCDAARGNRGTALRRPAPRSGKPDRRRRILHPRPPAWLPPPAAPRPRGAPALLGAKLLLLPPLPAPPQYARGESAAYSHALLSESAAAAVVGASAAAVHLPTVESQKRSGTPRTSPSSRCALQAIGTCAHNADTRRRSSQRQLIHSSSSQPFYKT